jgi:hypothetical protein
VFGVRLAGLALTVSGGEGMRLFGGVAMGRQAPHCAGARVAQGAADLLGRIMTIRYCIRRVDEYPFRDLHRTCQASFSLFSRCVVVIVISWSPVAEGISVQSICLITRVNALLRRHPLKTLISD